MSPLLLRQLWSLVETTQASILLTLDDANLVQWLVGQFKNQRSLDHHETHALRNYIQSRLSLIRDLAQERPAANFK
jgi:succinate dehydrogenase flavin-adding protein (antitoxin of CptAB toxin-antitoxin module)